MCVCVCVCVCVRGSVRCDGVCEVVYFWLKENLGTKIKINKIL